MRHAANMNPIAAHVTACGAGREGQQVIELSAFIGLLIFERLSSDLCPDCVRSIESTCRSWRIEKGDEPSGVNLGVAVHLAAKFIKWREGSNDRDLSMSTEGLEIICRTLLWLTGDDEKTSNPDGGIDHG